MISRRLVGLATAALAVLAACTTEEASNPGPTLTSTTSTTTTTTTTTTTSTTTSTTTTTTTTAPPTTMPDGPAAVAVPLFAGGDGGGWLPIGAWQVDRWQEDESASAEDPGDGRGIYDPEKWAVVFKYTTVSIPLNVTVNFANHPRQLFQRASQLGGNQLFTAVAV